MSNPIKIIATCECGCSRVSRREFITGNNATLVFWDVEIRTSEGTYARRWGHNTRREALAKMSLRCRTKDRRAAYQRVCEKKIAERNAWIEKMRTER